ncbi:ceramidase domain-containing protein [Marinovum sp. SP66]|uniref:ceramidase domain-containing protein n=1 Tax=Marinovum TaxID=367771 RepID=UPI00237AEC4C|nr:ceramidase domain-containing protein [Marinovum sp. SP66]MDD9739992.1 ceramidase domain-containing protein [Marinovum sp. SP66]
MDWGQPVDGYCERLGPGLWAEPLNAVTNLAFLVVALWLWPRVAGRARLLCAVLAVIGLGSGLFHTFAQAWAGLADVLPIAVFVLLYLYLANRAYWRLPVGLSLLGVGLFFPYAALVVWLLAPLPGVGGSAAYLAVALLIALYALALRRRLPHVARGLALGAALLALSITFRALDGPLCAAWPIGTHFLWHLLNAAMLGWMIVVYHRHMVAGGGAGR